MPNDVQCELDQAIARVLASTSRKKLVVAGPGAGKTTLFRKLLDAAGGAADRRLVLTFINNLKADLERSLGDVSNVFTLHGYCQHLLRSVGALRGGLTANFKCYPGLVSLIKSDWGWLNETPAPKFVDLMRNLNCSEDQEEFYVSRADYYDAVDFDDSVYRVQRKIKGSTPQYDLVLIDEFQDFNRMEAAVIDALAEVSPIVIAGDDDQALYSQLRAASWDHIRAHHRGGHYDIFELPFCMRCPEVIVGAVSDIVETATKVKKLDGRISKPYRYFEPVKGADSRLYPTIDLVETSVQRGNANYFGRYIEECVRAIPEADVKLAAEKHEPAALVIGSNPYRRQVEEHLMGAGLLAPAADSGLSEQEQALAILHDDQKSNLGWRIILSLGDETAARTAVRLAAEKGASLFDVVSADVRARVLKEAGARAGELEPKDTDSSEEHPAVKVTSYEGSKGLSAQYVFLVGLHSGDMPRDALDVKDIEICRLLVGLTRTKKKCSILVTKRFGERIKQRSEFIRWIKPARYSKKRINSAYWKKK
jgi:superfamily I DNA/RNA helicase